MKKGLGSIPKGLAWIDQEPFEESQQGELKVEEPLAHEKNSSQDGLPDGWTRATFIIKQEYNNKLKAMAYWDRLTVKEIVNTVLEDFLKDKKVKSIPKKS